MADMKIWKVPVTWEVFGVVEVEAETVEKAMEIARDDEGIIPLPTDNDYIDGSWKLADDSVEYVSDFK